MGGIRDIMKYLICKSKVPKIELKLEEYIPLKIVCEKNNELVKHISYYNGTKSSLEISVGVKKRFIKRITLLLSEKYIISDESFVMNDPIIENGQLRFEDYTSVNCPIFQTILYIDGVRIILSTEKSLKYVKMDRLYIGISSTNQIAEICIAQLNCKEVSHIKNELLLQ